MAGPRGRKASRSKQQEAEGAVKDPPAAASAAGPARVPRGLARLLPTAVVECLNGRRWWVALCCVAIAVCAVYANSLQNDFVIDDTQLIVKDPRIRSLRNIPQFFIPPLEAQFADTKGFRVIRSITYALDYQAYGLNPRGYHATNVLLHALAASVAFLIAGRLLATLLPALFVALLFAVHPVQTEAVSYIAGRKDVLCAIFYLAGFYSFMRYRDAPSLRHLAGILVAFLLAILSKESGITFPLTLLIFDSIMGIPPRKTRWDAGLLDVWSSVRGSWRRFWRLYLGLFLVAAIFSAYVVLWSGASARKEFWGGGFGPTVLTSARIYLHYVKLLLFPLTLSATYAFPVSTTLFDPIGLVALAAVAAILYGLTRLVRISPIAVFGGLWFFITLLPVSQLVPHHILVADRHLYLPSFGFALLAGVLVKRLRADERTRRVVYPCAAALLLVLSLRTVFRNRDWRDQLTLWSKTVETAPRSARAHATLGELLRRSGRLDEAEREFQTALSIEPGDSRALVGIGALQANRGEWSQAEQTLIGAIRNDPALAHAYLQLGHVYQHLARWDAAEQALKAAEALDRNSPEVRLNLALVYLAQEKIADAEPRVLKALELSPQSSGAHLAMGRILLSRGRTDEAMAYFRTAADLGGGNAYAYNNLGALLMQRGQVAQAIEAFRSAVRIKPDLKEPWDNLVRAYARLGRLPDAERLIRDALRTRPTDAELHYQLGVVYRAQGQPQRALAELQEALRLNPGLADARRALAQLGVREGR